eukprot:7677682-Pyramimonas_sp.AAC.1
MEGHPHPQQGHGGVFDARKRENGPVGENSTSMVAGNTIVDARLAFPGRVGFKEHVGHRQD